jgi:hypothetical protein
MTADEFTSALRAFARRRPFRRFLIELISGDRLLVGHPEGILSRETLFLYRNPDGGFRVFAATSVCQLIDLPRAGHSPAAAGS